MATGTRIGRTVVKTWCKCCIVTDNNKVIEETIVLMGRYGDCTRAQNAVRKLLNNQRVLVQEIWFEKFYASMPLEKFIENADIPECSAEEESENN